MLGLEVNAHEVGRVAKIGGRAPLKVVVEQALVEVARVGAFPTDASKARLNGLFKFLAKDGRN